MKKWIALLLVLAMALSLAACGAKEEDVIGLWRRETTYLPAYGCDADMYVAFADGEYIEVLLDHDTDELLNLEYGEWEIVKGKVEAQAEDDPGTTVYKYTGGKLKNGDLKYTRISDDAEEILDLFF